MALAKIADNGFYVVDRYWVDAGEGFVEQDKFRLGGQCSGYFCAPPLTTREADAQAFSEVGYVQFLHQLLEPPPTVLPVEVATGLQYGQNIVFDAEFAKD